MTLWAFADLVYEISIKKDFHKIIITSDMESRQLSVEEYKSKLLPKYIALSNPNPGEPKYMGLRKFSKAIDIHTLRGDEKRHEFLYSELLLYRPFREEKELYPEDDNNPNNAFKCAELYNDMNVCTIEGDNDWVIIENASYKVEKVG